MKNTNTDLKNHLFALLEGLMDKEDPIDLDRAKVVVDTVQTVVNASKLDLDYARLKVDYIKSVSKSENPHLLANDAVNIPFLEPKEDYFDGDRTLKLNPNMPRHDD